MRHTENKLVDGELWKSFKKEEKQALSQIYNSYVNQLFRYGKKFTNDNDLIKDTIQDLFFDLIRTRSTLGQTDNIYFYLIKAFRRRITRSISESKKQTETWNDTEVEAKYIAYSIEDELIQKEHLTEKEECIRNGLAQLSPKQREIIYYRYTCDFEYDQICEIMSIKYDSARKMMYRAIQTLRRYLSETNFSFFLISGIIDFNEKKTFF